MGANRKKGEGNEESFSAYRQRGYVNRCGDCNREAAVALRSKVAEQVPSFTPKKWVEKSFVFSTYFLRFLGKNGLFLHFFKTLSFQGLFLILKRSKKL